MPQEYQNKLAEIVAQIVTQLELYKQLPEGAFESSQATADALILVSEVQELFFGKMPEKGQYPIRAGRTAESYLIELQSISRQLERELKIFY